MLLRKRAGALLGQMEIRDNFVRVFVVAWVAIALLSPPTASANKAILVSGGQTHSVLRYDGDTGAFLDEIVSPGSGGLEDPKGLTFGPDDNLYVCSSQTDEVLLYDGGNGDFIEVFVAAGSGNLDIPQGLVFGPDGDLYVASSGDDSVKRYDGETGAFIEDFVLSGSGGLDRPRGMVFGPDGDLYVASSGDNSVKLYDGDVGEFLEDFVTSGSGGLDGPRGVAFGPDGHLYVASRQTDNVLRYDGVDGGFFDIFVSGGGLDAPAGLLFGSTDGLFVSSALSDEVLRFDEDTGAFEDVFEENESLDGPLFLTEAPETPDVDPPVQINNAGSTVADGGTDTITSAELEYVDAVQAPSSVTYTVTSTPVNGQLELTSHPGTGINSFTQAQINDRLLVYVHQSTGTTSDSFDFDVGDGVGNTLENQTFSITVGEVDEDEDDDQYCWVTLAVGGSPLEKELSLLRRFRDSVLRHLPLGGVFIKFYYKTSQQIATFISNHEYLKATVRLILAPLVYGIKYPTVSIMVMLFSLVISLSKIASRENKPFQPVVSFG